MICGIAHRNENCVVPGVLKHDVLPIVACEMANGPSEGDLKTAIEIRSTGPLGQNLNERAGTPFPTSKIKKGLPVVDEPGAHFEVDDGLVGADSGEGTCCSARFRTATSAWGRA